MSEVSTVSESPSEALTQKYSMAGYKEVGGKKVQVGIGAVDVGEEFVSVETLAGCSRDGLLDTMKRIAQETGKPTKAMFEDQEVLVEPQQEK